MFPTQIHEIVTFLCIFVKEKVNQLLQMIGFLPRNHVRSRSDKKDTMATNYHWKEKIQARDQLNQKF